MNSSPTNLQMPAQIEAKSGKSAPAAASKTQESSDGRRNEAAFAQALHLLQSLTGEVVQNGSGAQAKNSRSASHDASKPHGDGKDLPLTAWMLSLVLPHHLAESKGAPTAQGGGTHAIQGSGDGQTQQLGQQLKELMKLLEASGSGTKGVAALKNELAVLKHAASLGATTTAATTSSTPLSAALAAQTMASSPSTAGTAPSPSPPNGSMTPLLVADPGFAKALGDRVAWLAGSNGNHSAQLQLNPPQLGPLQVHVRVDGHHTEVLFQAQHAGVRDTLEAALPRLREMLSQGGQQVSVNIQQQFAGGGQGQFGQGGNSQAWQGPSSAWPMNPVGEESSDLATPLSRWYGLQMGAIDTYV